MDKMLYSNVPSALRGYSDHHKVSQSTVASQSLLTKLAYTVKSFSFLFFEAIFLRCKNKLVVMVKNAYKKILFHKDEMISNL